MLFVYFWEWATICLYFSCVCVYSGVLRLCVCVRDSFVGRGGGKEREGIATLLVGS